MNEAAFAISLVSLVVVPLSAFFLLKNTLFDISNPYSNPWPLLWYFTLATVLVPVVIVSAVGVENAPGLFLAQPGTESMVASVVFATMIGYVITLAFSLRLFNLALRKGAVRVLAFEDKRIEEVALVLSILGLVVLVICYFWGYKHAFLSALLEKRRLLEVRLANKYASYVPSKIASIVPFIGYFLSALAGYMSRKKLVKSLGYLFLSILFLSAPGDKAPPVWGVIIWMLAQGSLLPKRVFSFRFVITIVFFSSLLVFIVYWVMSLQMPTITVETYFQYLFRRLGIGQMAGVYETFGLVQINSMPAGDFYLHMIPGARLFVNYTDYQKVLMMITEGYGYEEMGVKNSLFIAEAWAIGGPALVLLSPIIVGLSTGIGLLVLTKVIGGIVGKELAPSIALLLYLKTHDITGGFSDFPLFKGLILTMIQILIIILSYYLFTVCKKVLRNWGRLQPAAAQDGSFTGMTKRDLHG